jgi:hypothetical protein
MVAEDTSAAELPHVKAFIGKFLDCQAPLPLAQ